MRRPRILLVNPHIEDFAAYDHFSKPYGLLWLAAYLADSCDVSFLNALSRTHRLEKKPVFKEGGTGNFVRTRIDTPPPLSDIPRQYRRYGLRDGTFLGELESLSPPDFIFLGSGMTYWYGGILHTLSLLKRVFPKAVTVLGGIYPSLIPEHARETIPVDHVVEGQDIDKVLARIEAVIGIGLPRGYRMPAYGLAGEYYYAPILSSTGCVFSCNYCAGHRLAAFRQFNPGQVAGTVDYLYRSFGVRNFAFYDDALLVRAESHIDPILERMALLEGIRIYTPNGLHVRFLARRTALLLKKAGCVDVRLSLESSDAGFQEREGGKTRMEEFLGAMEILRGAGFGPDRIKVYLLLNVPGQDPSTVESSMEAVHRAGGQPMLAFYSPIPGTPDFGKAAGITDVSEPLFQNNTVYLYRSGFDMRYLQHLKNLEKSYRAEAAEEHG